MADSMDAQPSAAISTYEQEKSRLPLLFSDMTSGAGSRNAHREEMMYSPLISLAVKHAVDHEQHVRRTITAEMVEQVHSLSLGGLPELYPQYATLGCSVGSDDSDIVQGEPIMLNTNSPASTSICGSQGSGKSCTLACMVESCLLRDEQLGTLKIPLAGRLFHYDVDSERNGLVARGLLVIYRRSSHANKHHQSAKPKPPRSMPPKPLTEKFVTALHHFAQWQHHRRSRLALLPRLKAAYEASAGEHSANHSILPLLLQDHQLTNERMQRMMSVFENECKTPLYMDVIMRSLRDVALDPSPFSMVTLEALIQFQTFDRVQENFLKQRMDLLKSFCSSGARSYHTRALENAIGQATRAIINSHPPIPEFDVLQIEPGTLTIVDLSDPSISTSTACMLFDICLSIAKEKPITSGLVIALDEAHRYIDSCSAATTFTNSLLTTIR